MVIDQERSKFEHVVRAYSPELFRYAYWLCRDRFTAEDLVQETFTRAWQGWSGLRDDRAAKGWLYTILRNEHARLHARKQLAIDPDRELDELMDSSGANAFNAFEMRDMLAALPETYREPLMLQVIGGFGCAEIARMIGITEGAVMTRLTRARQALRRLINPKLLTKAKATIFS